MPVPPNLNYEMWLGSTPTSTTPRSACIRRHGYDRPGWLRCEQFGAGHDHRLGRAPRRLRHWGMDTEFTGPIEIWGKAEFPKKGLWNVHGPFKTEAKYANGVNMIMSGEFPNGIKFEGTEAGSSSRAATKR